MLLRDYRETGMSKRAIARKLKISPDTLCRWIEAGDLERDLDEAPVQYGPRAPVSTKLDRFKLLIQARLDAFPELSSVRLLEEIQADGYSGGYTQLKAYVRMVRPRPEPEPIVRFETPPAHQAQVDFAESGASGSRSWSCSATRACSGSGSTRSRTCAPSLAVSKRRSPSSEVCPESCSSIR